MFSACTRNLLFTARYTYMRYGISISILPPKLNLYRKILLAWEFLWFLIFFSRHHGVRGLLDIITPDSPTEHAPAYIDLMVDIKEQLDAIRLKSMTSKTLHLKVNRLFKLL